MLFRAYLLERPDERDKLTEEEARYFGFKRDPLSKKWVDAWDSSGSNAFQAEAIDSDPTPQ